MNMTKNKSVRFSEVIRYSDNCIGYLEDDIVSTCSDESDIVSACSDESDIDSACSDEESKERHLWQSSPSKRNPSLPNGIHSILSGSKLYRNAAHSQNLSRSKDDSILKSTKQDLDTSGRSLDSMMPEAVRLVRTSKWSTLLPRNNDISPPVMPKRQLSGNSFDDSFSTPPTSPDSFYGDIDSSLSCDRIGRWGCNVPPPPLCMDTES